MSIQILDSNNRLTIGFAFHRNKKSRIHIESSLLIDIFLCGNDRFGTALYLEEDKNSSFFSLRSIEHMNKIIKIPISWKDSGWSLIFGNPNDKPAAVYYAVYDV